MSTACPRTGLPMFACTCSHPHDVQTSADAPTDLLGDPLPATPPMTAPIPWAVFQMNDCDWWVARSREEALDDYERQTGVREEEECEELTAEQLDSLKFRDTDEDENPTGDARTFREELTKRVAAGLDAPEMFASTEC